VIINVPVEVGREGFIAFSGTIINVDETLNCGYG
jgi:hypothetical protein